MTRISKTTFVLTVIHRTDRPVISLRDGLFKMEEGSVAGMERQPITNPIADHMVAWELRALGRDRDFFALVVEEEAR